MITRPSAHRIVACAAAAAGVLLVLGCARQESGGAATSPPSARESAPRARQPNHPQAPAAPAKGAPESPEKPRVLPEGPEPAVERLHTPDGVVTITRLPKATPADLGVPVFPDAKEKESAAWRMKPPQGDEWVLAVGEFTTAAALDRVEQFYAEALGKPEVRQSEENGRALVVLSRVKEWGKEPQAESESIVVRVSRGAATATSIVIRRAVRGAPVKLEPGELPGERKPAPKPGGKAKGSFVRTM